MRIGIKNWIQAKDNIYFVLLMGKKGMSYLCATTYLRGPDFDELGIVQALTPHWGVGVGSLVKRCFKLLKIKDDHFVNQYPRSDLVEAEGVVDKVTPVVDEGTPVSYSRRIDLDDELGRIIKKSF